MNVTTKDRRSANLVTSDSQKNLSVDDTTDTTRLKGTSGNQRWLFYGIVPKNLFLLSLCTQADHTHLGRQFVFSPGVCARLFITHARAHTQTQGSVSVFLPRPIPFTTSKLGADSEKKTLVPNHNLNPSSGYTDHTKKKWSSEKSVITPATFKFWSIS